MDIAISLLRELLKDRLDILKPSDHPRIESAIAILEAANGVDRERALAYLAKWKNCFGSGHLDDESEDDMRECIRTEIQLHTLIEALPEKGK